MTKRIPDWCFVPRDLYIDVNPRKGNIGKTFSGNHGCHDGRVFCGQVLMYLMFLIICDIIENNVTFELPLFNDKHAYIYVDCVEGDELKNGIEKGAYKGIDFIKTEFKAYHIVYQGQCGIRIDKKNCCLDTKTRDGFYSKINSGKQYY